VGVECRLALSVHDLLTVVRLQYTEFHPRFPTRNTAPIKPSSTVLFIDTETDELGELCEGPQRIIPREDRTCCTYPTVSFVVLRAKIGRESRVNASRLQGEDHRPPQLRVPCVAREEMQNLASVRVSRREVNTQATMHDLILL
jgi:hypothetical protein